MTITAWPSRILPLPQRGAVSSDHADLTIRSALQPGPWQVRNRSVRPLQSCGLVWMFTDDQMAIFDAIWHHTLSHGAAWISIPIRGESGTVDAVSMTCRLAAGYQATLDRGRWRVSATAEIDDPPHAGAVP